MKTNIILTILYLSFCCHITNAQITEHEAFNILENKVITKSLDSLEIFVTKTLLPNNTEVTSYSNTILKTTEDSWMFFIDEQPFENWSHQCKYVFINSSENFKVVEATMFPTYPKMVDLEMINSPSALYKKSEPIIPYQTSLSLQDEIQPRYIANKYALIISGGVNSNNNHERYWNDCSSIYTTLVKKYYYSASNIYVLMADGTDSGADLKKTDGTFISSPLDLDGNGTNDIKYSATKANLRFVFSELANELTPNDLLFIYTMDHGGFNSNGSYLCLWGNSSEYMDVSEFTSLVNQINAKAINIVMGQCNSGGFVEYFKGNSKVSITTACKKDESSYAMSNLKYDEFVYYWTEAYNNTLSVHSNFISTEKAFNYAKSHDTKSETPQFYASNFNSTSVSINDVWTEVTGFVNFNGNGSSHLTRSFDGAIGTIPIKTTYPIEIVITHPNTPISTNWSVSNINDITQIGIPNSTNTFYIKSNATFPVIVNLDMPNYEPISFRFVLDSSKSFKVALEGAGTSLNVEIDENSSARSLQSKIPTYEIYNINGTKVANGKLPEKINSINTSNFRKGIYVIIINSNNDKFENKFTIS